MSDQNEQPKSVDATEQIDMEEDKEIPSSQEPVKPVKRTRSKRSPVYAIFNINKETKLAKCKHCTSEFSCASCMYE